MPGAGPEHALGLARPGTGHTRRRAPRLHCETSGRGEYRQFTRVQPLGQVETNHCVLGLGSAGWRSFCFLTIIVWGPKGGSWGPPEPQSWGTPQSCSYREPVGGRARGQQGAALGRPLAAPSSPLPWPLGVGRGPLEKAPDLLAAAGGPGSVPHHEALGRCPGLLVDGGLHVDLQHLAVRHVGQLWARGGGAVSVRSGDA